MNKAARELMLAELKDVVPKPIDPQKLHSFTFPTSLAWNGQRILRFISPVSSKTGEMPPPPPRSKTASPEQDKGKEEEALPWNLRRRRENQNEKQNNDEVLNLRRRRESQNENQNNDEVLKLGSQANEDSGERKMELTIRLTAKEIEADFLAMAGKKPARRPKKRAKRIQQQIDDVFPGIRLSKITPDLYKVEEQQY
ncbi:hypothetical protein LUZ60_011220 [Juncus effusus]|nr:hypothetical protein LUZ60_011220 [Juncus effusus]